MDSTNPLSQTSNYVDLLNSQQACHLPEPFPYDCGSQLPVFSTQATETSSFCEDSPSERRETYFGASPKVGRGQQREPIQCKQRWQKMNDLVCKFCGAYAATTRQKTSGQSESDVIKLTHEIFFNDHKIKFNLHHAWEELKHEQKWCALASSKLDGSSAKKRRCEDGAQSASSQATTNQGDHPNNRPPGVKAAKGACGKRPIVDQQAVSEFQGMWSIKEKDLAAKERLKQMGLLESLISKKNPYLNLKKL
ncbi:hypothetical protein Bca101_067071 [Brassica carinata]